MSAQEPVLYVLATPIGNLADLSSRAVEVLKSADLIAAEDTRQTQKLLSRYNISDRRMVSYHDHNESTRAEAIVDEMLRDHLQVVIVSDAGTPCIADPGYRVVDQARQQGIKVVPIPGPSALTTLVSVSGLPSDRVLFVGFLPTKEEAQIKELETWKHLNASVVFYESAKRLEKTLGRIAKVLPSAIVVVGREMTKAFEEIVRLPVGEMQDWAQNHQTLKGEVAVMVSPGVADTADLDLDQLRQQIETELKRGASTKDIVAAFRDLGLKKKALYELVLEVQGQLGDGAL